MRGRTGKNAATYFLPMALALAAILAAPFAGRDARAEPNATASQTQLLKQLYLNGLARMAQGDPGRAISAFQVVTEVAPSLPQGHYSLALAMVLADFDRRERALPEIDKALAALPGQPLFVIVKVMADPALSSRGQDGALYLTAEGAARLRQAATGLDRMPEAHNARYLVPVLAALEETQDSARPYRLANFSAMVGANGKLRLPQLGDTPQAFGRFFALSVADSEFGAYEGQMVARLQNGLDSLSPANIEAARYQRREEALRGMVESAR
jgi:tetratricopeptide (TPR) repeat protein